MSKGYYKVVLDNIKKTYKDVVKSDTEKKYANKEPKKIKIISYVEVTLAIIFSLVEIIASINNCLSLLIFGMVILVFMLIFKFYLSRQITNYQKYYQKRKEDKNNLCSQILEKEAAKYDLNKDQLVIYLLFKHKMTGIMKFISIAVSIVITGIAVYKLPGFEPEMGIGVFILLILCNCVASYTANYVIENIFKLDEFDFFITDSYIGMFNDIDKKVCEMKYGNVKNKILKFLDNNLLRIFCIIAIIYSILYFIIGSLSGKSGGILYNLLDWLNNISISVITVVFFYFIQICDTNSKKDNNLKKCAKEYIKSKVIEQFNLLLEQLDLIIYNNKTEDEVIDVINSCCSNIQDFIKNCFKVYITVLPDTLADSLLSILFDQIFYMLSMRSSGRMKEKNLETIVKEEFYYNLFKIKIEKIKIEVEQI